MALAPSPFSLSRPATMAIPIVQAIEENSMSLRLPTWSTIAVPVNAPMNEVTELTKLSTRCLSGEVIPASLSRVGRKSEPISSCSSRARL